MRLYERVLGNSVNHFSLALEEGVQLDRHAAQLLDLARRLSSDGFSLKLATEAQELLPSSFAVTSYFAAGSSIRSRQLALEGVLHSVRDFIVNLLKKIGEMISSVLNYFFGKKKTDEANKTEELAKKVKERDEQLNKIMPEVQKVLPELRLNSVDRIIEVQSERAGGAGKMRKMIEAHSSAFSHDVLRNGEYYKMLSSLSSSNSHIDDYCKRIADMLQYHERNLLDPEHQQFAREHPTEAHQTAAGVGFALGNFYLQIRELHGHEHMRELVQTIHKLRLELQGKPSPEQITYRYLELATAGYHPDHSEHVMVTKNKVTEESLQKIRDSVERLSREAHQISAGSTEGLNEHARGRLDLLHKALGQILANLGGIATYWAEIDAFQKQHSAHFTLAWNLQKEAMAEIKALMKEFKVEISPGLEHDIERFRDDKGYGNLPNMKSRPAD